MTEPNQPPTAPQTAPAAPATPSVPTQPVDPNWLNGRIAQAKQSAQSDLLKQLGVTDVETAKSAIAAANAAADAKKSADTRAAEATSALEAERAKTASLSAAVKAQADAAIKDLKPEQLAAVQAVAGDDPAKQLTAIAALRPTWATPIVPAPTTQQAPTAPTNTAPPRSAPTQAAAETVDHAARYGALKQDNPFAAAQYRHANERALADAEDKKT